MRVCTSYTAGKSALPDLHSRLPEGAQRLRESVDISGKARVPAK